MDRRTTISTKHLGHMRKALRSTMCKAFSIIELLMALAIGALLMAAMASAFAGTASVLKVNQANLMGLRSARVAMDMIMSQLRKADSCQVVGTPVASGDAAFPFKATELSIIYGKGAARSDCDAGDYLETHVQVTSLTGGKTGLRIWKNSDKSVWNGVHYTGTSTSGAVDIPNIVSATVLYGGDVSFARCVQIQIVVEIADQQGRMGQTTLTSSTTIRRE